MCFRNPFILTMKRNDIQLIIHIHVLRMSVASKLIVYV